MRGRRSIKKAPTLSFVILGHSSSSTPNVGSHDFMALALGTRALSLGLLVPVQGDCNATAYSDIQYSCVLPTSWQQFGDDPQTLRHIV